MKFFKNMPRDRALITAVIVIAVVVRIASFAYLSSLAAADPSANQYPVIAGDSAHYTHWAQNLLTEHAYREEQATTPKRGAPPGYSALLAFLEVTTGSMATVVVVQTILSCMALALIYKMARTLLPPFFAIIPALVYALDPMVVLSDTVILTDSIFSALMVIIVYLTFFYTPPVAQTGETRVRTQYSAAIARLQNILRSSMTGMKKWFFIGLLLGVATMIRPIAEFFVIVFPVFYLFRTWMDQHPSYGWREFRRSVIAIVGLCIIGFSLIVVPWMIRNEIDFKSFEISNIGTHNLLTNDVRGFLAWRALAQEGTPMPAILVMRHSNDSIFTDVDQNISADLARMTPPGGDPLNYEGHLAMQYILSDPIHYAYFHLVNTIPFFLSSSIASYGQVVQQLRDNTGFFQPVALTVVNALTQLRHPTSLRSFLNAFWSVAPTGIEIVWWFLITVIALIALALHRKDSTVLLCAMMVIYFSVLTGPMSDSRYRVPAEPYLITLAAVGAYTIVHRKKSVDTSLSVAIKPASIA